MEWKTCVVSEAAAAILIAGDGEAGTDYILQVFLSDGNLFF